MKLIDFGPVRTRPWALKRFRNLVKAVVLTFQQWASLNRPAYTMQDFLHNRFVQNPQQSLEHHAAF